MKEIEKLFLAACLRANNGNKERTAKALNMRRATLYAKLYRYGLFEPKAKAGVAAA